VEIEIGCWRCSTEDESTVVVIEYQHLTTHAAPGAPVRRYPGARRLALSTRERARYIDEATFEVVETGELLRRID